MSAARGSVAAAVAHRATVADYLELCKVRLVSLVLFTTGIGFVVGYRGAFGVDAILALLHTIFGTGLVACGSMALNQAIERDSDAMMMRTRNRPVVQGRIAPREAWLFGVTVALVGASYLLAAVNAATAGLAVLTLVIYLAAYTPLKRLTTLNTVVGAVSGAIPPMVGYAAATGGLGAPAWGLFGILFVWQMPHFLGIAWMYREDYSRAGLMMLPVVDREGYLTAREIVLFAMVLVLVSLLPTLMRFAGPVYFGVALALGIGFVGFALPVLRHRDRRSARQVFIASVIYLPLLLAALMADRVS